MNSIELDQTLTSVAWLSAKEVTAYQGAGCATVRDLLLRFPNRLEDRRLFDRFPNQPSPRPLCLRGLVVDAKTKFFGKSARYFELVLVASGNEAFGGRVHCRWFNMPYLSKVFAAGQELIVYGKPKDWKGVLVMDHPEFEVIDGADEQLHLNRVVPVYAGLAGVAQRRQREIVWSLLPCLEAGGLRMVSAFVAEEEMAKAWRAMHYPESLEEGQAARRIFAREEFFELQLRVGWRKNQQAAQLGCVTAKKTALLKRFYENLPFDLTGAQKRCVREIFEDMKQSKPMKRLLQGDVGSGKTLVAMCATLLAIEAGYQVAVMAPTQILAEQHYLNFKRYFDPLDLRIQLKTSQREEDSGLELAAAFPHLIIGTHSLLFEGVQFENLGLVIVDEQHKFGVEQRARLMQRGKTPDLLAMTATPIPRSLTLTIYGDLEVSVIDERPQGRGKVLTRVRQKPSVKAVKDFLKKEIEQGRQAYLVYPLVEESEKSTAEAALSAYEQWSKRLKPHRVGLLHGRMKAEEKEEIMRAFREGKTQVLVATTVIEVGVDVPNASVMLIHEAERFGLAQLHQLRGRIGRGAHKGYCVLLTQTEDPEALEKLEVLVKSDDGFFVAEEDLKRRGPGEVFGTVQSGAGGLRFAEYFLDLPLLQEVKQRVQELLASDPELTQHPDWQTKMQVERQELASHLVS